MRLLVAIDAAASPESALAHLAGAAWARPASVLLLTVVREPDAEATEARLRAAAERLRAQGLVVATRVRRGEAGPAIVNAAEEEKVDAVVVGAGHGAPPTGLGPVAAHVVARCRRDVVVLKP